MDCEGFTALAWACMGREQDGHHGSAAIVKMLLKAGARPHYVLNLSKEYSLKRLKEMMGHENLSLLRNAAQQERKDEL